MISLPLPLLSDHLRRRPLAVVYFFTPTCGPCRTMKPLLQKLETATGVEVVQVDAEKHLHLLAAYAVSSVPTVCIFQYGQEAGRTVGVPSSAHSLISVVEEYM